ncbi:MAG: FAD-dependent oxidoreductase, partial [Cyanobacteria bacterium]|nr:FAD-dependent oxidoreductase [Cyanobacteriota bacterium]
MTSHRYDLIVFGDEVESILTAVSAARMSKALQKDFSIALVRQSTGKLGGLSTRGGLSYMDITLETKSPLFREFLEKSGVVQVALAPKKAHQCLESLIHEENITVFSGQKNLQWQTNRSGGLTGCFLGDGTLLQGGVFIDATPDADMARQTGIPFMKGLGGVLGSDQDYLGVSPVFQIHGVPKEDLIAFEATLRQAPHLLQDLKLALPHHPESLLQEYLTRPCYSPDDKDYLDILNPVIGVAYHVWRHGSAATYPTASIYIDGANISIL